MHKIPTTIITGFLGSGKTSIMRHIIAHNNGKKLAFIINEFGDLGIDKDTLLGCGMPNCTEGDIVELSNGCICCTVADDFLPTMKTILDHPNPPDHILIETSGLALPKPLIKAFDWHAIKSRATVDGVIAIVDALALSEGRFAHDESLVLSMREQDDTLSHEAPLHDVFTDQLVCADIVVLNKADLVNKTALHALKSDLQQDVRSGVHILESHNASVDASIVLGLESQSESHIDTIQTHHDTAHDHTHDDFVSCHVSLGEVCHIDTLTQTLTRIVETHKILRIKGFVYNPQKPMRMVLQGVGPRFTTYFDRPWHDSDTRDTRLMIIGTHDMNTQAVIHDLKTSLQDV